MNTRKHNLNKLLVGVAAIFFLLGSTAALGGTTGKISGRILDKNKEPLPSTNVVLVGTTLGAVTDIEGYYSILNIPPGRYDVLVRLIGYRAASFKGVQVSVNNTTKLDATLEDESITTDVVVVTAKRPVVDVNLTSSVATITDKEISALPVQELQDIVNLQAGVVDGHFRGGRAGEVQFQVNGVSVNNSYDNKSSIKIDRSLIQEVQVITGTFDAEYGQAMSGVVNTVLKSGGESFAWNAEVLSGGFLYEKGGNRGLDGKFRPASQQNYQLSISGPTGLPQTYFLLNGRRYVFDDYLYGTRIFTPADSIDQIRGILYPLGDGNEVVLGYKREWSGLAKIMNRSIPSVEISYQGLFNVLEERRTSDAWRWQFLPDGMKKQKTISIVHGLDWTHTLSASTFYNINLRENYFDYKDWVFDDFYDTRYDFAGSPITLPGVDINFHGVDFDRFRQKTNAFVGKVSVTSQVTREHQLKVGAELQLSNVQFGTAGTLTYKGVGGKQTLVRYVDNPPDYPGVQSYDPISLAAYGQDQIEWNDLTIRAGVRFEYFDARGVFPSDLANPANAIQGAPQSVPRRPTKKVSYAPRFGLSYPIAVSSSVFFSYGHFYQLPPLGDIFRNADYSKLERIQAGTSNYGVLGNPDIKPEKTVQYEFGYKHALTDFLGLSVNLFYKDIRDLLGVEFVQTYSNAEYARLTNVDFGNVTGFTISLDQRQVGILSSTIDYTWQMAQGNASDPRETATRAEAGQDPRPRQVPLNWDRRHTLNMTVQLSRPDNYSVSTIVRFGSGQPYTPEIGSGFGAAIEANSGRKPNGVLVDVRGEKYFSIAGMNMSLFARVFNLFDARYFNGDVFSTTGSPDYSTEVFKDRNRLADPTRYYPPRRIEVGIQMNSSF